MKKLLLFAALAGLLLGGRPAHAGTARTGHQNTGTYSKLSQKERALVGTWQMVAVELAGRRQPFPGRVKYTVSLRADGTARVNVPGARPKHQRGQWKVKGDQIVVKLGKTSMKVRYRLTGKELAVVPPGKSRLWIILTRLSKRG